MAVKGIAGRPGPKSGESFRLDPLDVSAAGLNLLPREQVLFRKIVGEKLPVGYLLAADVFLLVRYVRLFCRWEDACLDLLKAGDITTNSKGDERPTQAYVREADLCKRLLVFEKSLGLCQGMTVRQRNVAKVNRPRSEVVKGDLLVLKGVNSRGGV